MSRSKPEKCNAENPFQIVMKKGVPVRFKIVDSLNVPIADAKVSLYSGGRHKSDFQSDISGFVSLGRLVKGNYFLHISSEYHLARSPIKMMVNGMSIKPIVLEPSKNFELKLTDCLNGKLDGMKVKYYFSQKPIDGKGWHMKFNSVVVDGCLNVKTPEAGYVSFELDGDFDSSEDLKNIDLSSYNELSAQVMCRKIEGYVIDSKTKRGIPYAWTHFNYIPKLSQNQTFRYEHTDVNGYVKAFFDAKDSQINVLIRDLKYDRAGVRRLDETNEIFSVELSKADTIKFEFIKKLAEGSGKHFPGSIIRTSMGDGVIGIDGKIEIGVSDERAPFDIKIDWGKSFVVTPDKVGEEQTVVVDNLEDLFLDIQSEDGKVIRQVYIHLEDGSSIYGSRFRDKKYFKFRVPSGIYKIKVSSSWFHRKEIEVDVKPNKEAIYDVVLKPYAEFELIFDNVEKYEHKNISCTVLTSSGNMLVNAEKADEGGTVRYILKIKEPLENVEEVKVNAIGYEEERITFKSYQKSYHLFLSKDVR